MSDLRVTLYLGSGDEADTIEDIDVDFVSLVNGSTYGPPPLIAPQPNREGSRAAPGDKVLYINTAVVPAFEIERMDD